MLLNFYAITGQTSDPTLYKIQLTSDLQKELSELFIQQQVAFKPAECEIIDWSPQHKPEPKELLVIRSFEANGKLEALVPSPPALPLLSDKILEDGAVKAIVGVTQVKDGQDAVLMFQAINAGQVLKKSWLHAVLLDGDVFKRNDKTGLIVKHGLDALIEGGDLYMTSDYNVRRFLDLTSFFKEATDQEIKTFYGHKSFFSDDMNVTMKLSDTWVRRKITSVLANVDVMSMSAIDLARVAAKEYKIKLVTKTVGGAVRIVIPSDKKELKILLHFLDEDYLDSQLTNSRFEVDGEKRKLT
jgi:hypothetical protein